MGELACRLARESVFGVEVMRQSSVYGRRGHQPLPVERIIFIETIIQKRLPMMANDPVAFLTIHLLHLCTSTLLYYLLCLLFVS